MPTVIERAVNGQRTALLRLYEQTAGRVYNTALALSADAAAAKIATVKSYQAMWKSLDANMSEEAFGTLAVVTVIDQCKKQILQKNPKAFRIPPDRRFILADIPTALPSLDAPDAYRVPAALPPLYRLIFVCHAVADLDEDHTAALAKLDRRTLEAALAAEKTNIAHLLQVSSAVNADSPKALGAQCQTATVPTEVADAVAADIGIIAAPIEKARRQKTLLTAGIITAVCVTVLGLCALVLWDMTKPETTTTSDDAAVSDSADDTAPTSAGLELTYSTDHTATHYAEIGIRDYGTVKVALDANMAPETVANFKSLSESGFYDGLTFHRIIEGFMMQGGDPNGNGSGGSDTNVVGEFAENGYENTLTHTRGAISMARSTGYNSGSSQFFIVHEDSTYLDGQYAAFGYVTKGMDIVDAICEAAEPTDGNGAIDAAAQPVIDYIIVSEA